MANIVSGKQILPRRVFVYGRPGVGKTTWASQAPAPIFIPTEEGCNDLDVDKFELVRDFQGFLDCVRHLLENKHNYKTVVIDSVDWLEPMIAQQWLTDHPEAKDLAENYYRGWIDIARRVVPSDPQPLYWAKVLHGCNLLREHGMMVILLGHSKIKTRSDPGVGDYTWHQPVLDDRASAVITEWSDDVLFARFEVIKEPGAKKRSAAATGRRILKTDESQEAMAKHHVEMPSVLEFSYQEYANYLPTA